MVAHQRAVAEIVAQEPDIASFMSAVGAGGIRPTANTGTLFMILKPQDERKSTPDQIIQRLRPKLGAVPGIKVYMQNPPVIRIGGRSPPRSTNTRCRIPTSTNSTNGPAR
jgi:HAE1 family hydrophobic/amphiphilic exporter-1